MEVGAGRPWDTLEETPAMEEGRRERRQRREMREREERAWGSRSAGRAQGAELRASGVQQLGEDGRWEIDAGEVKYRAPTAWAEREAYSQSLLAGAKTIMTTNVPGKRMRTRERGRWLPGWW
jgi:SLT domain-containing protein